MTNQSVQNMTGAGERYLEGNFGPVSEERTLTDLEVVGEIPKEMSGRYLRNGPNPDPIPEGGYHWFFGDGMIHGIEIRDGKANWYRNRWVKTDGYNQRHGLGPAAGPPDVFPGGNNPSNTHVIAHAGKIFALCEVGLPYELTPELETVGKWDFNGELRSAMTAHPKLDPVTGEMHFFGYSFLGAPYLRYHQVDKDGDLTKTVDVDIRGPVMIHDFSITEGHAVFYDLPVVFDVSLIARGTMPFKWDPSYGARIGVMPRSGGNSDIKWFEIEPCYVFHQLNAFEQDGRVVVDVARYESMFDLSEESDRKETRPSLRRWEFDLGSGTFKEEVLEERGFDFPRVDERLVGYTARYGYGVEVMGEGGALAFGNLVKYDLEQGSQIVHRLEEGKVSGEGVFVPASPDAGEDEGWVVSYVYDTGADRSELVILDATDFEAEPVATVKLPFRIPYGFHGSWVADY